MKFLHLSLALILLVTFCLCACAQNTKAKTQPAPKTASKPVDPAMEQIRIQVEKYKPGIVDLFNKQNNGTPMKGLLSITLYLTEDGTVALSDINPVRGNFSNTFLIALEDLTAKWTFEGAKRIAYSFTMTLE